MSAASQHKDGFGQVLKIDDDVICLDYGYSPFRIKEFKYFRAVVDKFTSTVDRVRFEGFDGMTEYTTVPPNVLIKVSGIQ